VIRRAWAWLAGLRLSTAAARERARLREETWARAAHRAQAEKREAQRLLVLLSEPLKEWDLADFPELGHPLHTLTWEDSRHLAAVLDGYRLVASEAARVRMTATVNDETRQRGWADERITR
jgi:hypothetical protein